MSLSTRLVFFNEDFNLLECIYPKCNPMMAAKLPIKFNFNVDWCGRKNDRKATNQTKELNVRTCKRISSYLHHHHHQNCSRHKQNKNKTYLLITRLVKAGILEIENIWWWNIVVMTEKLTSISRLTTPVDLLLGFFFRAGWDRVGVAAPLPGPSWSGPDRKVFHLKYFISAKIFAVRGWPNKANINYGITAMENWQLVCRVMLSGLSSLDHFVFLCNWEMRSAESGEISGQKYLQTNKHFPF